MSITESRLRHCIRQLLKEEVYGTLATVYHGSKQPPDEFLKIFESGGMSTNWKAGEGVGSVYGHGLYSVLDSVDNSTVEGSYGKWLYKLKVNLYGFIIFDEHICKKVYGDSIPPLEQMKLIGKENEIKFADEAERLILSRNPERLFSSGVFQQVAEFMKGRVNGIVYHRQLNGQTQRAQHLQAIARRFRPLQFSMSIITSMLLANLIASDKLPSAR